jgi:hypothetical protein
VPRDSKPISGHAIRFLIRRLERPTKRGATFAIVLLSLGVVPANGSVAAAELPAAVKARLFERTRHVSFSSPVVRIAMRGTDHAGNRKCPYVQGYVNGKGPFTFLYDTGATYLIVSSKVAKTAAASMVFDRGGARDAVHVDNLSIGASRLMIYSRSSTTALEWTE